jgi:membrane fusion protein (multidrug efflux system)
LLANNFTPKATFDAARNTLQGSQQKLASLNAQLAGIAANLNGNPDAPIEDHPRYKDAVAARDEAARQLAHTIVRAPFAGIVTNVPSLQPGQYLAAAATAFNIVSTDHVWVQASPKETELTYVKPGQKVTVEVDTFPGQRWAGTVESISPASASSFSLLPAENTSGNWVKVVQRIPMRVRVNNAPGKPALRVGMSVEVSVDTGHERGLPSFITDLFGSSDSERG